MTDAGVSRPITFRGGPLDGLVTRVSGPPAQCGVFGPGDTPDGSDEIPFGMVARYRLRGSTYVFEDQVEGELREPDLARSLYMGEAA